MARFSSTCLLLASCLTTALGAVQVAPPAAPPGDNVTTVFSNFFGISLELSFINYYFGNDTTSIPQPVLNYLGAMHSRSADRPVKLRLGGNSMDSSTYVPDQQEIIKFTNPDANVNDQPVSYGAELFKIMKTASDSVGGVEWLIGLSLRNPNDTNIPLVAGDAQKYLGDNLDAYLVGNEPDLYTTHGNRPNLKNYTVNDYIGDYWVTLLNLNNTPTDGSVLNTDKIAGPTICCFWDLDGVLTSGWLDQFRQYLKYITLQHYPQNNCFGHYDFHLDYYMSHTQAVHLAQWQGAGLQRMASLPADQRKPVLMDEFNSASCGGIPQSNMFGIALWTADYALQMAAVGYSGAYIHTRERGVTYNLFDPPAGAAGSEGVWTTNANFYAVLAVTEALQNTKGSRVVDLNVNNSVTDYAAINAGYAIYDASSSNVHALVLFNYANASAQATDYTIPANMFSGAADSGNVLVRYLVAPTATETTNVTWGNLTYAGVADGRLVEAQTAWPDKMYSCAQGCTVQVPGPGMAVVFVGGQPQVSANSSNSSSSGGSGGKTAGTKPDDNAAVALDTRGFWVGAAGVVALAFAALA